MKKITTTIILLATLSSTYAQTNTFPTSGNVGIGTSAPQAKLHLVNTGNAAAGLIKAENTDNGTNADSRIQLATGTAMSQIIQYSEGHSTNPNRLRIAFPNTFDFMTSGVSRFAIGPSGVGIGTTDPKAELHVLRSVNGALAHIRTENGDNGTASESRILLSAGTAMGQLQQFSAGHSISPNRFRISAATNGSIDFFTSGTSRVIITNIGNVGIGTTNPDTKLNVDGSISVPFTNKIGFTTNDAFNYDGINTAHYGISSANGKVHISGYGGLSLFTNFGERLKIDTQGNVGIGTTIPGAKLDVNGDAIINEQGTSAFLKVRRNVNNYLIPLFYYNSTNGETLTIGNAGGDYLSKVIIKGGNGDVSLEPNSTTDALIVKKTTGFVGVGTNNPQAKLDVNGETISNSLTSKSNSNPSINIINTSKVGQGVGNTWRIYNMTGSYGNSLQFWAYDNVSYLNGGYILKIGDNGNMSLNGKLEAKEVRVTTTPTADFVFAENYDLPKLEEVEKHIKEKKHLPEIASAKEMEKDGVNVGEFQIKLLQKIEELTLYSIEQNKRNKDLEKKNEEQEVLLRELLKRIECLEKK